MVAIEIFFKRTEVGPTEMPSSRFHCLLDDQPSYLVPRRLLQCNQKLDSHEPLILNPQCWFSWTGPAPPQVASHFPFLEKFFLGTDIAWVVDPVVGRLMPFWLGPELRSLLSQLRLGDPVPRRVADPIRSVLFAAEIFVDSRFYERRRTEWANSTSGWANHFREFGYSCVNGLIHPFHIGSLRRYFRQLVRTGDMRLGDSQTSGRFVAHNEGVARFFHHQLAKALTNIVGTPVKPSYVYVSAYQSGAELPKHTDRAQCEYSLTLCIDHSPPEQEGSWPLFLETRHRTAAILQRVGDGLVYKGRELAHFREALPKGSSSVFLLFHFVPKDFNGSLD